MMSYKRFCTVRVQHRPSRVLLCPCPQQSQLEAGPFYFLCATVFSNISFEPVQHWLVLVQVYLDALQLLPYMLGFLKVGLVSEQLPTFDRFTAQCCVEAEVAYGLSSGRLE